MTLGVLDARTDEGITLVEVMVSITIMVIGLTAFASTIVQTLQVVAGDEQLVRANQCAADLLESVRVLGYNQIGVYSDDTGYQSSIGGNPTVTLGSTRGADTAAPLPQSTVTCDGTDYAVAMAVVWRDDPSRPVPPTVDPDPNDYKEITATLDWSVRGRAFQTVQSMVRQPSLDEVDASNDGGPPGGGGNCTPGEIVDYSISPGFVEITPSGFTAEAVTIVVEMCSNTAQVLLTPSPLSQRSMIETPGSAGIEFTYDFPAGTTSFNPGTYTWSISSTGTEGSDTDSADIQFAEQSQGTLSVDSLTIAPHTSICARANNNKTHFNSTLTAVITGADPGDPVTFSWTSNSGSASGNNISASEWNGTLPQDERLTAATTTITVTVTRVSDGLEVSEAFVVPVQHDDNSANCS